MTDTVDQQAIPPTLQAIRARLDLTQEQLAERLGVSVRDGESVGGRSYDASESSADGNRCAGCRGRCRRRRDGHQ